MHHAGDVHNADDLDEGQQHGSAVVGNGEGDEAEHADRGVDHHHVGDLDHGFGGAVKEGVGGLATFANGGEAEAEEHGEEDDLEHVALTHSVDGVQGDDVQEHVNHLGRSSRLSLEAFGSNVEAFAGVEDVGEDEAEHNGHGGGTEVVDQGLGGNAAELVDVTNRGGTGNDGAEHQRHDHHADEVDEQLAKGLEGATHIGEEHTGGDAESHTDCHLGRQADASFHENSSGWTKGT